MARHVEAWARAASLDVVRDETSVRVEVSGGPGPTLVLLSHLDVVPPGDGWTRDPWTPTIADGALYGRGSGDAKASVASMLWAARDVAGRGGLRGRLVVVLGYGEETRHTSMGAAIAKVGAVDAAVVGEPTNLNLAVAQRGLMMVDLVAHGDQRHAGYAATDGSFTNAAVALARDLVALETLFADPVHPVLGRVTATPTMLEGGISRNVTPPSARAVLDIRSTPDWPHDRIEHELRARLSSEVVVTSTRLVPCETPAASRIVACAERVRPAATRFGSPTCSDWVFVRDVDAVKVGPGTSRRSHTADECVDLGEVSEARAFYAALATAYLA